jgi:hypothetical protein
MNKKDLIRLRREINNELACPRLIFFKRWRYYRYFRLSKMLNRTYRLKLHGCNTYATEHRALLLLQVLRKNNINVFGGYALIVLIVYLISYFLTTPCVLNDILLLIFGVPVVGVLVEYVNLRRELTLFKTLGLNNPEVR